MSETGKLISILELRRLLHTIIDNRLDTCFRYRLLGEMWQPNFLRVYQVTEKGVLLLEECTNKLRCIDDLSHIMQFEIDAAVHNFAPHNHYSIDYSEKSNLATQPSVTAEHGAE